MSKSSGAHGVVQTSVPESEEEKQEREEREEREALAKIVRAFKAYAEHAEWEVSRWERNYERLSDKHKALLAHHPAKCEEARKCIKSNHHFIKAMLAAFDGENGSVPSHLAVDPTAESQVDACGEKKAKQVTPAEMDKVHYVLKNLMRDWSEDGAVERGQSYGRVVTEIKEVFAQWLEPPHPNPVNHQKQTYNLSSNFPGKQASNITNPEEGRFVGRFTNTWG